MLLDEQVGLVTNKQYMERVTTATLVTSPRPLWKSEPPKGEP